MRRTVKYLRGAFIPAAVELPLLSQKGNPILFCEKKVFQGGVGHVQTTPI